MEFTEQRLPPNPKAKATFISKVLFLWVVPLFKKGYNKELEAEDEDRTEHVGDKLERYWELELERAKLTGKKPSLQRVLFKISWKTLIFVSAFYIVNQCVFALLEPVFLRLLVVTFNEKEPESWKGYAFAGGLSLSVFLSTISIHPVVFNIMHLGMKLRVGLSSLIYRKALRLSKSAKNKTNSGQIVNLLSNDCSRFDINMNFIPFLVSTPFLFGALMYLLYEQIGAACLAGVAFILMLLPMHFYIGKYSAIFRLQIAKRTDERGRLMNEIIIGMRVIKQYAWEKPFSILIDAARRLEVIELRKRGMLRGLHLALIFFASKLVQYLTFLTFVLLEEEPMTADKVFFTLACLHTVIQITLHFMPMAAAGIGEMLVAIKRIQEFLLLDELQSNNNLSRYNVPPITSGQDEGGAKDKANMSVSSIVMQNVCACWTDTRVTLDNISFTLGENKLVMVVGPVGSSKTSLLHSIIDELPLSSGTLSVNGSTSYASQEPWIFSGNLRQNILFGLPHDETRYNETIKACALEEDFQQLPYGDMSVVGERGVALSGGQKARVNLARALYRKADIYLLDDPLSAVDTRVSRHLFEKCIKEHLRGSTRILVTHQLQYMPQADHIIVLNQGKILAQGTYDELVQSGIDFVGLMGSTEEETGTKSLSIAPVGDDLQQHKQQNDKTIDKGKPEENKEKKYGGSVTARTYWEYCTSGHSTFGFLAISITFIITQVVSSGNDWWLSFWTNAEAKRMDIENNGTVCADPSDNLYCEDTYLGENIYLYVFTGFVIAVTVTNIIRGVWFYMYCCKTSINIHDKMFKSMVRAPIKFFDDNPSGRIMNRFTKDVGTVDELLPPALGDTVTIFLQVFGVLCIVIISNHYMAGPTVVLFVILYLVRKVFVETARDIKRIESLTKSPVFTHMTATLQGLTTIRACKSQHVLIQQFEGYQDIHSSAWFMFVGANRCFGIWLELISDTFLTIVTFSFLLISTSNEGGNVGLAISSLLSLMGGFQWGMRQSAETENYMTSVERALDYSKISPEAELESKPGSAPPLAWPDLGQIEFNNVSLSYQEDKPVVKNLSFKIKPSEKIGIVGRTGAGKSSVITALFRLTEPDGEIYIDKVKVKEIGLHDLRKKISIIPQDPVLFSGSVRYNLDPFNQFGDPDLWSALEQVELKDAVTSLDYLVADGGSNFSVGQRQLVCLARAVLRQNKVLVMDEATANVDYRTDSLIQQTIRSKFSNCTIITIAHRLHSIIDCDRVLVLDHGILKEFDHPHKLLQMEDGVFTGMIMQTGQSTSTMLKKLAHEAYGSKAQSAHNP